MKDKPLPETHIDISEKEPRNPTLPRLVKPPRRYCQHNYNRPAPTAIRECLSCEEKFGSVSTENRVCPKCKADPSWRYGGGL